MCPGCFPGPVDRNGLKFPGDLTGNHIEMTDPDHNRQPASSRQMPPGELSLAFAAFALAHSGCGEETSELRLDERALIGWCRRCDDARVFVVDERRRRRQTRSNLVPEGGPKS